MKRNGHIQNYTLSYRVDGETVQKQISERIFTVIGLQPHSLYTFMVSALSSDGQSGPAAYIFYNDTTRYITVVSLYYRKYSK